MTADYIVDLKRECTRQNGVWSSRTNNLVHQKKLPRSFDLTKKSIKSHADSQPATCVESAEANFYLMSQLLADLITCWPVSLTTKISLTGLNHFDVVFCNLLESSFHSHTISYRIAALVACCAHWRCREPAKSTFEILLSLSFSFHSRCSARGKWMILFPSLAVVCQREQQHQTIYR